LIHPGALLLSVKNKVVLFQFAKYHQSCPLQFNIFAEDTPEPEVHFYFNEITIAEYLINPLTQNRCMNDFFLLVMLL